MPTFWYLADKLVRFLRLPFAVQWRMCLVRLPWLVPRAVLRFTAPEGPYPQLIYLPSRHGSPIPVYVFVPGDNTLPGKGWPVHIDFHGGGFIMGSCLEQAPWCAMLARSTGRVVLSVDYRKGPLDSFPAALEDSEDVLAAVLDTAQRIESAKMLRKAVVCANSHPSGNLSDILDSSRVSLSGFSSGGNLALNLVLSVRVGSRSWPSLFEPEGPTIPTLLFYPSFDSSLLPHERPRPPEMKAHSNSWFSSIGSVLGPTYLPKELRKHPRASPGLNNMARCLCKRVRILLILPEIDTLAEQSEVWVQKMHDQRLDHLLTLRREEDMHHGWTQFPDAFLDDRARKRKYAVLKDAAEFVRVTSDV